MVECLGQATLLLHRATPPLYFYIEEAFGGR
jgi:hypothetical protein